MTQSLNFTLYRKYLSHSESILKAVGCKVSLMVLKEDWILLIGY